MICAPYSVGRLLLLADIVSTPWLSLLAGWDVIPAENIAHARFLQQFDPFDVILVDGASAATAHLDRLGCLTLPGRTSLVVLLDSVAEAPQPQAGQGPQHWLPRGAALQQPALLAIVLSQATQVSGLLRQLQRSEQALHDSQRQADRLIDLFWQCLPTEGRSPWLPQRLLLERLAEEVARSQRYAAPLSVVLGELEGGQPPRESPPPGERTAWLASQVSRSKRRCDVAGQYGPNGFLLLLPETTAEGAGGYCRRLLRYLESPEEAPDDLKAPPPVRFATASLSAASATAEGLLSQAEERLAAVHKERGWA